MGSQNIRGIPPNRLHRNVDAPRKFVTAPPGVSDELKKEFDDLVRLMPAGFYLPAHRDALLQCCRIKLQLEALYERQQEPGYDPVPMDHRGRFYQNPVEVLVTKLRQEHHKWLTACRLTPSSAYNNRTVPRLDEEDVKNVLDEDAELQFLRSVV